MKKIKHQEYGFTTFEDGDILICYCPELDACGYGKTQEEAENSLLVTIAEIEKYGKKMKLTS